MSILFFYIYVSEEIWHLYLKNVEKNKKVEHFRLLFTYLQQNLYSIKERFALVLKNFVNVFFCVFQIDLNKAVNIFCSLPDWIRNIQMIQYFSTLKNYMRILNGLLKAWRTKKFDTPLPRDSFFWRSYTPTLPLFLSLLIWTGGGERGVPMSKFWNIENMYNSTNQEIYFS